MLRDLYVKVRKIFASEPNGSAAAPAVQTSVLTLTDDSQIGANLRVCADEKDRADFDQRS